MKWILSIFLIILLSCVNTYDGENSKLSEDKIQRMIDHMKKIKNLFRNLEESDTSGGDDDGSSESSEDSSDDSGSQSEDSNSSISETTPPSTLTPSGSLPITSTNTVSRVQVIGLHGFNAPLLDPYMTFFLFILFRNRARASIVTLGLSILYRRRLRDLQDVQNTNATCQPVSGSQDDGGNVKYSCQAPKEAGVNINQIVVNPDQVILSRSNALFK